MGVFKLIIAVAVALTLTTASTSDQNKPRVTGFFTNMEYVSEAADIIGMEVWIVYARDGYWATMQIAEGGPNPPVEVPVQLSGRKVSFAIPDDGGSLKFGGEVGSTALTGTFVGNRVVLKRCKSYWQ